MQSSLFTTVLQDLDVLIQQAAANNPHSRRHVKREDLIVGKASEDLLRIRDARNTLRERKKKSTDENERLYLTQLLAALEMIRRLELWRCAPGHDPEQLHVCLGGKIFLPGARS